MGHPPKNPAVQFPAALAHRKDQLLAMPLAEGLVWVQPVNFLPTVPAAAFQAEHAIEVASLYDPSQHLLEGGSVFAAVGVSAVIDELADDRDPVLFGPAADLLALFLDRILVRTAGGTL